MTEFDRLPEHLDPFLASLLIPLQDPNRPHHAPDKPAFLVPLMSEPLLSQLGEQLLQFTDGRFMIPGEVSRKGLNCSRVERRRQRRE